MSQLKHRKYLQQRLQVLILILLSCGIGSSNTIAQSSFIPFVLHIHASGGWDTTMVFENKIGKSGVSVETGATSATGAGNIAYVHNTNRPAVKTFFDTYGASAAIVNGINTGGINRLHALKTMMGAIPAGRFRYSDWISYYSFSTNPVMPLPHLVIDAPWMPGDYASVATLLPSSMIDTFAEGLNGKLDTNAESALAAFRTSVFSKIATNASNKSLDSDKLIALAQSQARNPLLYSEIQKAVASIGNTTADSDFVRNGKLAIEMFAQGSSQAVTLQSGKDNEWDTTVDNYKLQAEKFESLFSGLNSILSYAATRGVGSKLLVIVTSERGRAPTLNDRAGKNAWAFTSALLYGVGIKGGTTVGLTDDYLRGLPIDPIFGGISTSSAPLEMGNVMSAIYLKTNVPAKALLPNHTPLSSIIAAEES